MNKKDRFLATINREKVDRPAWWLGLPTESAKPGLYKYFNVNNFSDLKARVDDDLWTVDLPYHNGTTNAISMAFDFAQENQNLSYEERTLTSPGFFEPYEDVEDFYLYDKWPDPSEFISKEACKALVAEVPENYPVMGILWSAHFQDACSAFGMEDALVKMKIAPDLFRKVIDKITDFYLKANEIFYEYTKGKLDAVLIGNDFGTQTGLIVSPDDLREFVFGGTKKLVDQAHSYGLKVVHHSCGAVSGIIPDLINMGVDCIHPIQALANGMAPEGLKNDFGDKVSFCGGIDAQHLLVNGNPEDVAKKVRELSELFNTGLIISPSHEAILPDVPPENICAISKTMEKL